MRIKITIAEVTVFAELNESKTSRLIISRLPLESKAELWGQEVYCYITPRAGLEKEYTRDVMEVGDVAYWPKGPCFCLFFGLTPNSRGGKIMPASSVTFLGRIVGDPLILKKVKEGDILRMEHA
ncbi:hypothetical protein BU251_00470 [Candidatus Velamenicoccus archaeovorus]|uniref:Cyclophilin TM1367-like domain-containing protein n=1 Tax=Velamenicoccus archaeovorus TaxID=1930593 RepID=A0A410P2A7_VELA1|nr:cyclophilin-like fold protein [Candidatus Velamenicoccus archaeovorus]QAT16319.1 hypothetical protein BU251_00470 [Candidatus Velamenicoccus archaeovorus]